MEAVVTLERISISLDGKAEATFAAPRDTVPELEALRGKELALTVKPYAPRRSLTQNAYMWVMLGELGTALKLPKEEVYRNLIKDYGQFEVFPIKDEAVERFVRVWQARGLGWVCDVLRASKLTGYTNVIAYYGTSSYTTAEMSRIIDAVLESCREQGISTMSKADIMSLKNEND